MNFLQKFLAFVICGIFTKCTKKSQYPIGYADVKKSSCAGDRLKKEKVSPSKKSDIKHLNRSNMKKSERRQLTTMELVTEISQKKHRTDYERRAYRWLPNGMKKFAIRNSGVAFENEDRFACYPDLFFEEQRLLVEIDGGYHMGQTDEDEERDDFFNNHGYKVVHIKNADTIEEIAFLETLLYELRQIKEIDNRVLVKEFIEELHKTINMRNKSMLTIDKDDDNYITEDFELPMFNHKLMQRRIHNCHSLEI